MGEFAEPAPAGEEAGPVAADAPEPAGQEAGPKASAGVARGPKPVAGLLRSVGAAAGTQPLPDPLRVALEAATGVALDDVSVHYGSTAPARMGALAYTQGADIHVGPGQEGHLPHEAWHVVQQRQGRVRPTLGLGDGSLVNDDPTLEAEADREGARILRSTVPETPAGQVLRRSPSVGKPVRQAVWEFDVGGQAQEAPIDYLLYNAARDQRIAAFFGDTIVMLNDFNVRNAETFETHDRLLGWLRATLSEGTVWTLPNLLTMARRVASDQDPLHGPNLDHDDPGEDDPNPEIEITLENMSTFLDLRRIPPMDLGLQRVFGNLARSYGYQPTEQAYRTWYSRTGVWTRASFRSLFEGGGQQQQVQFKRTPGALSYQEKYTTYNFGDFEDVTYKLDGDGNIAFAAAHKHKTWTNPVKPGSQADLEAGSAQPGFGLMVSGKVVKIQGGARGQHYSIANRILGIDSTGSPDGWTWHHLTPRYHMVLVDRQAHAKHGHNGGNLIW